MPTNELLRYLRERYPLTQEELAGHIGVLPKTAQNWEYRETNPSPKELAKLTTLFGKSARELGFVRRNEWPPIPFLRLDYLRNEFFTGREDILQRLHDQLVQLRPKDTLYFTALVGMGGVGKTHIAVEYAHRHMLEYQTVEFLNASSREDLAADFADLAYSLFKLMKIEEQQDQDKAIRTVKDWLGNFSRYLLVFDNVLDLRMIADFLPGRIKGDVIVTTQFQPTGTYAEPINVEPMAEEEGVRFLLRRSKGIDKDTPLQEVPSTFIDLAREIVVLLEGLPLALDQAGAYIEQPVYKDDLVRGLTQYIARFQKQRSLLLGRRGYPSPDHPNPVTTTLSLALKSIKHMSPRAIDLLKFFAFLAPESIPEILVFSLFLRGSGYRLFESNLEAWIGARDDAMNALFSFSLIQRRDNEKVVSIHTLVQAVMQDRMKEAEQRKWANLAVSVVSRVLPSIHWGWGHSTKSSNSNEAGEASSEEHEGYLKFWQRHLPQVFASERLIMQWNMSSKEAVILLYHAGEYLDHQAQFAPAERLFQLAVSIAEKWPESKEKRNYITLALNEAAGVCKVQGKYEEALQLYQRIRDMLTTKQGTLEKNDDAIDCLRGLGSIYVVQDKYDEAQALLQQAVEIALEIGGVQSKGFIHSTAFLAEIYTHQHKYKLAEEFYQEAIARGEEKYGKDAPVIASWCTDLAEMYIDQKENYVEAEKLLQRALPIALRDNPDHPLAASIYNNLGNLYREQRKFAEAVQMHDMAGSIYEKVFGVSSYEVALSWLNVAEDHVTNGEFDNSMRCYLMAWARLHHYEKVEDWMREGQVALTGMRLLHGIGQCQHLMALKRIMSPSDMIEHFEEAEKFYVNALEIAEALDDQQNISGMFGELKTLYNHWSAFSEHLLQATLQPPPFPDASVEADSRITQPRIGRRSVQRGLPPIIRIRPRPPYVDRFYRDSE